MKTLQASQPEPPEAVFRERGPPLFPFSLSLPKSFFQKRGREREGLPLLIAPSLRNELKKRER